MATDDQNTVRLRVQVIDLHAQLLDLQVPTYLPARDLTARIARDAGLEAFWADQRRRLYWIWARGRRMEEHERLADLGVVNGELVYLLPQVPAGSGVVEQLPAYPETRDYVGAGWLVLAGSLVGVLAWAVLWGTAIVWDRSIGVVTLPGLALGFLCVSVARHAWGGRGNRVRVAATALVLQLTLSLIAFLAPAIVPIVQNLLAEPGATPVVVPDLLDAYQDGAPGIVLGMVGVLLGWLAWWGGVEPLPPREVVQAEKAAQTTQLPACGVCGLAVDPTVRADCVHGCGQVFHSGCYKARQAVYQGSAGRCAVCGRAVV